MGQHIKGVLNFLSSHTKVPILLRFQNAILVNS